MNKSQKNETGASETEGPAFSPPTSEKEKQEHRKEPQYIQEIEAEVDANIAATWFNNAIGFAALSMSAFLIWPQPDTRQLPVAYGFACISIITFIWTAAVYFSARKRHWTTWIMLGIIILAIIAVIGILVIL
jgi:hypothetical protein